jgi:hypothetical protein
MAHPVKRIRPRPEDDAAPARYPRDLDPQLVRRGKDAADGRDLVVIILFAPEYRGTVFRIYAKIRQPSISWRIS